MSSKSASDYSAMQREYYNDRAKSLTNARALVHPDYGFAAAQAPGFVRFLLQQYFAAHGSALPEGVLSALALERGALKLASATGRPPTAAGRSFLRRALGYAARRSSYFLLSPFSNLLLRSIRSRNEMQTVALPAALDFGCGVGRLMRPFAVLGTRVDGVDISREMLSFAAGDSLLGGCQFFESNGADCGAAPSATYDLVYSAICMQHIASRTVRRSILADMRRVLREGGMVALQFHYYPSLRDEEVPAPHVPWSADAFDASGTNSEADVWITPESIPSVLDDFRASFSDPALFFCEFPQDALLFRGAYGQHQFEHVIVTATAGPTRADAIYSL